MSSFFSLEVENIRRLGPQRAVDVFRELLWSEATRCKIARSLINVPTAIFASDGGVDAEITDVDTNESHLIKKGLTRYQIKTGEYALDENGIKKILFKDNGKELKPRIESCFKKSGTLVIVLFDQDLPDREDDQYVNKFRQKLKQFDSNYKDANIELLRPNQLLAHFSQFPSLCLKITGRDTSSFFTHQSWSTMADMRPAFRKDTEHESKIKDYREKLRDPGKSVHIRVNGEPGIGKTRFVLELTNTEDLSPLVIYCDSPTYVKSNLLPQLAMKDNPFNVILVVDECNRTEMADLWRLLDDKGPRIKLITIYSEGDDFGGTTQLLELPKLDNAQISKIIEGYGFAQDQIGRWVPYCSGSPRVAHVIGQNLKENPEDLTKSPDIVPVWERFIANREDMSGLIFKNRKKVLMWLSLFKKFGYEIPLHAEFEQIAAKINQYESALQVENIRDIIVELRKRKVLQGRTTLYITPKLLHLKLWMWWWDYYGKLKQFTLDDFKVYDSTTTPPRMFTEQIMQWFYDMLRYAGESQEASYVVKELLGPDGPFSGGEYLKTETGAKLFLALAEADPSSALRCLQRTVATWSFDERKAFSTGRREVLYGLQYVAADAELFQEAARIILLLAEAENEIWSNNATGIFTHLFSMGLSPTAASPEQRLPILSQALLSNSKEIRMVALKACDSALESDHFIGIGGFEQRGLRKIETWRPKKYEELFDAYRQVWQMLSGKVHNLDGVERQKVIDILCERARGLSKYSSLAPMAVDTLRDLVHKGAVDKRQVLSTAIRILHYDGKKFDEETRRLWDGVKQELEGNEFHSLMERYVGINLFEDLFEDGKPIDRTEGFIEKLADDALNNRHLLRKELVWLTSTGAENGYRFGYKLALKDSGFTLLPELLQAQRNTNRDSSVFFLGGYFRGLQEIDTPHWEQQLEDLMQDDVLCKWIPELTWRCRMTNAAAMRVLRLVKEGRVDPELLNLFALGGSVRDLKEEIFSEWIDFLLRRQLFSSIALALDLYHFYYLKAGHQQPLPDEVTITILTHKVFVEESKDPDSQLSLPSNFDPSRFTMIEYYWTELAKAYARQYSEKSWILADWILEHFGKGIVHSHSQVIEVLTLVAKMYPIDVWMKAKKYLGPPIDERAFHIEQWLRGMDVKEENGFLSEIPLNDILSWVNEDVEKRAWYLASFVPKAPFDAKGEICPREVLVHFGVRPDVRRNLTANFLTEFFSGPASVHYRIKKNEFQKLRRLESNPNVKLWMDEYLDVLDQRIKESEISEERNDF